MAHRAVNEWQTVMGRARRRASENNLSFHTVKDLPRTPDIVQPPRMPLMAIPIIAQPPRMPVIAQPPQNPAITKLPQDVSVRNYYF
jgi:hypothetical protein